MPYTTEAVRGWKTASNLQDYACGQARSPLGVPIHIHVCMKAWPLTNKPLVVVEASIKRTVSTTNTERTHWRHGHENFFQVYIKMYS